MVKTDSYVYREVAKHCGTPTFVYSEKSLKDNIQRVKNALVEANLTDRVKVYVAYFTNSHPRLFKILADQGVGTTLQSREEYYQLKSFGLHEIERVVSPTALSDKDSEFFLNKGLQVNVALPEELRYALQRTDKVGLRIDLSPEQKQRTGVKIAEFDEITQICQELKKSIHAIHTYPGTGSEFKKLIDHAEVVFRVYKQHFPEVKEINLGGGFAFDYEAVSIEKKHFPWKRYFVELSLLIDKYSIPKDVKISIEPGRDIFADVGEFLIKVNRVHTRKNERVQQAYTDGSYIFMPSATIRERQHELKFFREDFREDKNRSGYVELSGCTTLSTDYLFPGIVKAPSNVQKESYIVIKDMGAYGASQHMEFLNKRPAAEVLMREDGILEIITERGGYADRLRYALREPRQLKK